MIILSIRNTKPGLWNFPNNNYLFGCNLNNLQFQIQNFFVLSKEKSLTGRECELHLLCNALPNPLEYSNILLQAQEASGD